MDLRLEFVLKRRDSGKMIDKVLEKLSELYEKIEQVDIISEEDFDLDLDLETFDEDEVIGTAFQGNGEGEASTATDREEGFNPLAVFMEPVEQVDESKYGDDLSVVRSIVNLCRIRNYGDQPIPITALYNNILCDPADVDEVVKRHKDSIKADYNICFK